MPRFVIPYRGLFIRHSDGGRAVADPNHLIVLDPKEPYRVTHPADGGDGCLCFTIPAERLQPSRALSLSSRDQLFLHVLWADLRNGRGEEQDIATRVARWTASVLKRRRRQQRETGDMPGRLIERVKTLLMADLAATRSLAEIGEAVERSPGYLNQLFRRVEGESLHRYQIRLRLAAALRRLPTCTNLTALAFDLGFSQHSHFGSAFRQHFGVTPSAFRRYTAPAT